MSATPSHTKLPRSGQDPSISGRILAATIHVILRDGPRRLRTAEIARAAGTTESTVYRHFENLDDLMRAAYDHAWDVVNTHVSIAAFSRPVAASPVETLLGDTDAIWGMRSDTEAAEAAMVALLFMRRRHELVSIAERPAEAQTRFEERMGTIARSVVDSCLPFSGDREHAAALLRTLVMNYVATIWFTWDVMPAGTDDITAPVHDLSPDEAQLGVLSLVERAVGVPLDMFSRAA